MEVDHRDFQVLKQLGKGKGGYSYLVTDGDNRYVLKQIHHEPCDYYQFGNKMEAELRDYRRLQAVGIPMPRLLDADMENERILKEYVEGETVYTLICRNEMNPDFEAQVRKMCDALYPAGLNIDYFPTNFVARDGKLRQEKVETGRVMYGYVELVGSGLTGEDYIAFPYNKDVRDGAPVKLPNADEAYGG